MKKITDDYIIGFDIGTNSTGWVAMDKKNNILHVHGKNTIGVRKFREGKTAADRRSLRATRRRLKEENGD